MTAAATDLATTVAAIRPLKGPRAAAYHVAQAIVALALATVGAARQACLWHALAGDKVRSEARVARARAIFDAARTVPSTGLQQQTCKQSDPKVCGLARLQCRAMPEKQRRQATHLSSARGVANTRARLSTGRTPPSMLASTQRSQGHAG